MPKARRARDNLHRRLIYTTLFSIASTSTVAQYTESLCNEAFSYDGITYNLKSLAIEHAMNRTRETPPSTMEDELRFNICEDLTLKAGVPEGDQCPAGTRACLIETNKKDGENLRVITVIPVAQTSLLKPSYSALQSPDGLSIQLQGPPYPPNTSPVPQSLNLTLLCTQDNGSEPTFVGYENGIASVEWMTGAGCPVKVSDGDDNNGSEGGEQEPGDDASSSGSGVGWFFLLLLISFIGYFAVGAYYNYNNFGATGWDLVPHRDFWRDVPYLLQDFTEHLCSTLRPGRQGSRRGYVAV